MLVSTLPRESSFLFVPTPQLVPTQLTSFFPSYLLTHPLQTHSGDIEDAPGLDGLHTYTTSIKNDQIYVSASMKVIKSKKGRSPLKSDRACAASVAVSGNDGVKQPATEKEKERVVIVGGGSGAIHTLEALREIGWKGDIIAISKEKQPPFDRTKLSKALITDQEKIVWRSEKELKDVFGVDLRLGTVSSFWDNVHAPLVCKGNPQEISQTPFPPLHSTNTTGSNQHLTQNQNNHTLKLIHLDLHSSRSFSRWETQ